MNINHLRYFEEVCKQKNITKASEQVHVSQPSVTAAIKELENLFGIQLFLRKNSGISLTSQGEAFLVLTQKFLKNYDDFTNEALDLGTNGQITLRLGIPSVLGTFFLKKIVPHFELENPGIHLQIYEIPTISGVKMIDEGSIDFLIGITDENNHANCDAKLIFETNLVVALSPENPLSKEPVITKEMLLTQPFVIISKGSYHYDTIMEKFKDTPLHIIFHSNQVSTIKYMVANNHATTIIYKEIFETDPCVCCVPFEDPMAAKVNIFWRKNAYVTAAMKAFICYIQNLSHK